MYLVYQHTSPSGKVYVGITSQSVSKRWQNGKGYTKNNQPYFNAAINKYGWNNFKHEIILENVLESEAKYTERYLIRWYKLHKISYNITDGGEGMLGHRIESVLKHIYQFDLQGNLIKDYSCIKDAANALNYDSAVISHSVDKTICKDFFFFSEEGLFKKDQIIRDYNKRWFEKRVVKLDLDFQYIESYDSIVSASKENNLSVDVIGNAISRKTRGGQFYWIKEKDLNNIDKSLFKKPNTKSIILINAITKEEIIFNTIVEATKFLNYKEDGMLRKHAKAGTICRGYYIRWC